MRFVKCNHRVSIEFDLIEPVWGVGLDKTFTKKFVAIELFFIFFNFRISAINLDCERATLKEMNNEHVEFEREYTQYYNSLSEEDLKEIEKEDDEFRKHIPTYLEENEEEEDWY